MAMEKLGADLVYDYRDDTTLSEQNRLYGVFRWGTIRFPDEDFNPLWAMYRPPTTPMAQQLANWYRTPMPDQYAKNADGLFRAGIPYIVFAPMTEFWLQHPLLKPLRKDWENCKVMQQSPWLCIEQACEYLQTCNRVAEQPFQKCPKASVAWIKCLDDNSKNFFFCRDLQVEWEACMSEHFNIKLPPFPKDPRRLEWNAGQDAPYRMRFKRGTRDHEMDWMKQLGMGTVHPEWDMFHENL